MTTETVTEVKLQPQIPLTPPPDYDNANIKLPPENYNDNYDKMMMELNEMPGGMRGGDQLSIGSASFQSGETWSSESTNIATLFQETLSSFLTKHKRTLTRAAGITLLIGYSVYFGFSIHHSVDTALALIIITGIAAFLFVYTLVRDNFGASIYTKCLYPIDVALSNNWFWLQW